MGMHLTPLEKEQLVRKYLAQADKTTMKAFCQENGIKPSPFSNWVHQFKEKGLDGLVTSRDAQVYQIELPEGIDDATEYLKRELMKARIENERLKKSYTVETNENGERVFKHLKAKNTT